MQRQQNLLQISSTLCHKQSINDDLRALPPDKTCEDKYFIGFFEYEALVGLIDLIIAYPDDELPLSVSLC